MGAAAGDLALLLAAHGLLRVCTPLRAHFVARRIGRFFRPITTREEARRMAFRLRPLGSCLSRSLAVAARARTADVVIAVEPSRRGAFMAHAWVELGGEPIDASDVMGSVIVRLGPEASAVGGT
jgi:hypothetical protein